MAVTDEQVTDALQQHCQAEGGGWSLPLPGNGWRWYETDQARALVRACLILGIEVTGSPGAEAWVAVAARLEALDV